MNKIYSLCSLIFLSSVIGLSAMDEQETKTRKQFSDFYGTLLEKQKQESYKPSAPEFDAIETDERLNTISEEGMRYFRMLSPEEQDAFLDFQEHGTIGSDDNGFHILHYLKAGAKWTAYVLWIIAKYSAKYTARSVVRVFHGLGSLL